MAPARVWSYTRTIGPPGPSQHCFSCRLMALLCNLLSMLMVTAVACYSHHLLSWSKKRGSCCCFKITVTPHHFPNEGETPELSLWEWLRYPGHTTQGPYPAWTNHGANGRRCSAWISLGQGTAQWACVGAWEEITNSCPSVPTSFKATLQGLCVQILLLWGKTNRKTKQNKNPCKDQCKEKSRKEWGWLLGN